MNLSGVNISGLNINTTVLTAVSANLVLSLDAATYSGSGPWIDSVNNKSFTLHNSPTYNSDIAGGSFNFSPSSSQYASASTSLSSMNNWSVEAWHYYDGTNSGVDASGVGACIITEVYPGSTGKINYSLGNDQGGLSGGATDLQSGFFNGAWRTTPTGYTLTSGNWYHIVGTYNGSNIKMYVNNNLVGNTSYTGTSSSSGGGIRLMRRWDNADYWGGRLGIIRIYNTDIGANGVSQNWATGKSRFGL